MNKHIELIPFILIALCGIVLGVFLQFSQEATLFYRELRQLFLFDSDYMGGLLRGFGGVGTFASQFLIQFFRVSGVGATVTAGIGILSGWLFWCTLRRITSAWYLSPLALFPVVFQYLYLLNHNYHYEGLIALFFGFLALAVYGRLTVRMEVIGRMITGSMLALGLLFGLGSVALWFAVILLLYELLVRSKEWYAACSPLLVVMVAGALAVQAGMLPDYDTAFWMKDYVEYFIDIDVFYGLSWQSSFLLMLLFALARYVKKNSCLKIGVAVTATLLPVFYYQYAAWNRKEMDFYTLSLLYHYIDTGQWDAIRSCKEINYQNMLHLNCLNLALSHAGKLQSDLFNYPQRGVSSLMSKYQAHIEESMLFSQIYYQMGVISLAYDLALGASIGITYGSPMMTKTIIKSHLIYGRYAAAEKFIAQMEKTWAYRDWASSQRRFLYNDKAVENDPELGERRRGLTGNRDIFANLLGVYENASIVLEANPKLTAAADYAISALLLSKDLPSIKAFVERYAGTEVLPALSLPLQQAVISCAEHDPDYCWQHGVSKQTWAEFMRFKEHFVRLRRTRRDLATGLIDYRHTFWYYLLLNK